ncbi:MAG: hypothetical protein KJ971_07565 [Firmicutes bacterium]|nr:hypothetical protein [Bacillota bacterium]
MKKLQRRYTKDFNTNFPTPFTLLEIKEKISFSTDDDSNNSNRRLSFVFLNMIFLGIASLVTLSNAAFLLVSNLGGLANDLNYSNFITSITTFFIIGFLLFVFFIYQLVMYIKMKRNKI